MALRPRLRRQFASATAQSAHALTRVLKNLLLVQ